MDIDRDITGGRHRRARTPDRRRRALEDAGWRTWLTYRENHRRDEHGRMIAIDERWVAELEHVDGTTVTIEASSPAAAWLAARECCVSRWTSTSPAAAG